MSALFFNPYVYSSGGGGLYTFSGFTFTPAGATGPTGPTISQINTSWIASGYSTTYITSGTFSAGTYSQNNSGGIWVWTVPQTRSYTFTLSGAGTTNVFTNYGITFTDTYTLTQGHQIAILVGQTGIMKAGGGVGTFTYMGGNGGTFVYNITTSTLLFVAGGSGGNGGDTGGSGLRYKGINGVPTTSGSNNPNDPNGGAAGTGGNGGGAQTQSANTGGGGGGGYSGNGGTNGTSIGGNSFLNGGLGATSNNANGGFGGAGADGLPGAGGGGGYSGGGGGSTQGAGCGAGSGGSYSINNPSGPIASYTLTNSGNGSVIVV